MLRKVDKRSKDRLTGKPPVARHTHWPRPLDIKALKTGRVQPDLSRQVRVSGGFSWKWNIAKVKDNG